MSIAEKLVNIAEKIQRVFELKDNKPYIDTREITDWRFFNQEGKRDFLLPKLDTSNGTNFYYFCRSATSLKVVPNNLNFSKASQLYYAFYGCTSLHTVEYIDFSSIPITTSTDNRIFGIFYNCSALENITIKENSLKAPISFEYSPLLSNDSIQSIVDCLVSTTGVAKKLTLHKDTYAKLTEAQFSTIANKGWEVVSA